MGTDRERDAGGGRTHGARPVQRRSGGGGDRRAGRPTARKTPLDDGQGARAVRGQSRAGWAFVSPALIAIGLFFVVPAAASLFLSFTDFDIYALADLSNLRFIG